MLFLAFVRYVAVRPRLLLVPAITLIFSLREVRRIGRSIFFANNSSNPNPNQHLFDDYDIDGTLQHLPDLMTFGYSKEDLQTLFEEWGPEGRQAYYEQFTRVDYYSIMPSYCILMAVSLLLVTRWAGGAVGMMSANPIASWSVRSALQGTEQRDGNDDDDDNDVDEEESQQQKHDRAEQLLMMIPIMTVVMDILSTFGSQQACRMYPSKGWTDLVWFSSICNQLKFVMVFLYLLLMISSLTNIALMVGEGKKIPNMPVMLPSGVTAAAAAASSSIDG